MKPDLIAKAQKIIRESEEGYFSFINEKGYPETATRSNVQPEGFNALYFVTDKSGAMGCSLEKNKASSVCFRKEGDNVTLVGDTTIVSDKEKRNELWQDWFLRHFPEGLEDPEYTPVKFETKTVSLWVGGEQQRFTMEELMKVQSRCGLLCDFCSFVESHSCKGCVKTDGNPFYGKCAIAQCCQDKGLSHCGQCEEMPCQALKDYSCGEGEHCDNPKGSRLEILRMWADS